MDYGSAAPQEPRRSRIDPKALLGVVEGAVRSSDWRESRRLAQELAEADTCWGLLDDIGRRLSYEREVRSTLPWICHELATRLELDVAFGLAGEVAVDKVITGPYHDALSRVVPLAAALRDDRSPWSAAVRISLKERREVSVPGDPALRDQLSSWPGSGVVVPVLAPSTVMGSLVAQSPYPAAIRPRAVALLHTAAQRLALALEQSELEKKLRQVEDANEAARFREELLAALSHDMQTPLAVLLGSIRALQALDDIAPKHRTGLYESMGRRGAQLQRLVAQFLDFARLEAGRPIAVRPVATDVKTAIARMQADVGWRRPLEVDVADDLPAAIVDPDRLDQVLANLVSNAVKFSPPDTVVTVRAKATPDAVEVEIADRGPGMSAAELKQVFGKFYRGEGAESTSGTGLGLYVCRAVLEAQGGRLLAESQEGEGSRFTVVLPRTEEPAAV